MTSANPAPGRQFQGRLARTLLLTLLLLSMVPLLLMSGIAYLQARSLLSEQIHTLLGAVAEAQSRRLLDQVQTGQLRLSVAAANPEVAAALAQLISLDDRTDPAFQDARRDIFESLQTINQPTPIYNQFLVVFSDGEVHAATTRSWEGQRLSAVLDFASRQPDSTAVFGLDPLLKDQFVILSAVPYRAEEDGARPAVLVAIAESPAVQGLVENVLFFSTNQYFVTPGGQFVGLNPYPNSFEKLTVFQPGELQREILMEGLASGSPSGERSGVREFDSFNGQPVIAAYTWLPELNLGWVVEVTQESVYSQVNSLLLFATLLFLAIASLMALFMWLATQRLFRPLGELTRTVQGFAEGHWELRADDQRNDEVGLLACSFNDMADELTGLYHTLEAQVEERTRQIRANAHLAEVVASSFNLDELLNRTASLFQSQFGYPAVAIYLVDESRGQAVVRKAAGPDAFTAWMNGAKAAIDDSSLVGAALSSQESRLAVLNGDNLNGAGREDLLPRATAEAAVPVVLGGEALGALYVQTEAADGLNDEQVKELETLANQIAPALQNFYLLEAAQINLGELNLLYNASYEISQAESEAEVYSAASRTLRRTPFKAAGLLADAQGEFHLAFSTAPEDSPVAENLARLSQDLHASELGSLLAGGPVLVEDLDLPPALPPALIAIARLLRSRSAALLPVRIGGRLLGLLVLGAEQPWAQGAFSSTRLPPFTNFLQLIITTVERMRALRNQENSLTELRIIENISQAISAETDIHSLYRVIHQQISQVLGQVDLFIALYNPDTQMIQIPYMTEGDKLLQIDPFPLGEGLTSILIRTRQPLLLGSNTAEQAASLGAKVVGGQAKSWLGVPLLVGGEVTGAIVVQDSQQENRFNENHQRLLTTLAGQVAVAVRNASLLEQSRRQAEHDRQLYEISTKIRRSTDIQTILQTTATELGLALRARRAQVEIRLDEPNHKPGQGEGSPPVDGNGAAPVQRTMANEAPGDGPTAAGEAELAG